MKKQSRKKKCRKTGTCNTTSNKPLDNATTILLLWKSKAQSKKERKKDEKIYQIDELSNVDTTESINEDDEIW